MNLLYLVHRIPYPPDKGDKIRSHRWLEHLAGRHRVHLVTLYDDPADAVHLDQLREICASVHAFPLGKTRARIKALCGLLGSDPLSLAYFDSPKLRRTIQEIVSREAIDLALCYSSSMAGYLDEVDLPARVMDMVDVDSEKFRSYAALGRGPTSWLYRIEAGRLARYEERIAADFGAVILCTEPEAALLADRVDAPEKIFAIGNGVALPDRGGIPERRDEPRLLFIGAMDYQANVDAVVFAAREIMPLILAKRPDAVFQIVGRDPSAEVRALASLPGVEVTGGVPDITTYLAGAALSLVPLRIAQGIQNKILEAMAWELPVVTAPKIAVALGQNGDGPLVTAETPEDYARKVLALLDDSQDRRRRGLAGREVVTAAFAWEPRLAALDALLDSCLDREGVSA